MPGAPGPWPQPGQTALPASLIDSLNQARSWGFLGDGPLEVHVAHARGFAAAADSCGAGGDDPVYPPAGGTPGPRLWMDLGSGGGIPGLVLAHLWPHREAVLLDSNHRRARFLIEAAKDQGWQDRIRVVTERAEVAGRDASLRGQFSLVVARSFASPPVTAECAAPFLRPSGVLIVSEPPSPPSVEAPEDARWPREGLAQVGLERLDGWRDAFGFQILRQSTPCPDRFPRRVGVPGKRPLYRLAGT